MPHLSRTRLQQSIDDGFVTVHKTIIKASYKIKAGDEIVFSFPNPVRNFVLEPQNIPIDIVYEDEDLLLVNKNNYMVVHPGCGNYTNTLVNALLYHFDHQLPNANTIRPGLVHRIDKHTSGLLLIAKTEEALFRLSEQFQNRTIDRRYHALVWGNIKEDIGTINGHIGRAMHNRKLMAVYPEGDQGKYAVTHWRVLQRFGYVTLVECKLETGRTHQIRAHFKHIGHPLFNDKEYGGDKILRGNNTGVYQKFVHQLFKLIPSQALHAKTLSFVPPRTKEAIHFYSALHPNIQLIVDRWQIFLPQVNE
jgi:23S rRNA pseudouridine1911/1915/1917 synthase